MRYEVGELARYYGKLVEVLYVSDGWVHLEDIATGEIFVNIKTNRLKSVDALTQLACADRDSVWEAYSRKS